VISGVSTICFAASYGVALLLEISRLFLRIRLRTAIAIGMGTAGLVAHSLYLWDRFYASAEQGIGWHEWCLVAAWVVAATYLYMAWSRPRALVGLFLLPLVLALVAYAYPFQNVTPFTADHAAPILGILHGVTLLAGTVITALGFASGIMYLVQSYWLKHKQSPRLNLQLPSLEWMQLVTGRLMVGSITLLTPGLLLGVWMNVRHNQIPWGDPVILTSGLLLGWLVVVGLFNWRYQPASRGVKVAYLTVAGFVILALVLSMVLLSGHAIMPGGGQG